MVVILTVQTQSVPHIDDEQRVTMRTIGEGLFDVTVPYGFIEDPDVPAALARAEQLGLHTGADVLFFLGRETIIQRRSFGCPPNESWSSVCRWKCRIVCS
jgi:KUP system potassium uptake protein